jgi:hypothetical protein
MKTILKEYPLSMGYALVVALAFTAFYLIFKDNISYFITELSVRGHAHLPIKSHF